MPFDFTNYQSALLRQKVVGRGQEGTAYALKDHVLKLRDRYGQGCFGQVDPLAEFARRSVHRLAHAVMGEVVTIPVGGEYDFTAKLISVHQATLFGKHGVSITPRINEKPLARGSDEAGLAKAFFFEYGFNLDLCGSNTFKVDSRKYGADLICIETMRDTVAPNILSHLNRVEAVRLPAVLRDLARLYVMRRLEHVELSLTCQSANQEEEDAPRSTALKRGAAENFEWNSEEHWLALGVSGESFRQFMEYVGQEKQLLEMRQDLAKEHMRRGDYTLIDEAYARAPAFVSFSYFYVLRPLQRLITRFKES